MLVTLARTCVVLLLLASLFGAIARLAIDLALAAMSFVVPVLFIYAMARMLIPRRPVSRVHRRSGLGWIFPLSRLFSGLRPSVRSEQVSVMTFLGERGGRLRSYELTSRFPPVVAHGDIVRVIGVPTGGRVSVLMMRAPTGTMFRRGLFGRLVSVAVLILAAGVFL